MSPRGAGDPTVVDELPEFNGKSALSGADMLALLTRIDDMLGKMEQRILDRLTENAVGAAERWKKHDDELERNTKRVVDRFEIIEKDLLAVSTCLNAHLDKEHDDEIATQARVRPVKTLAGWLVANWKSIALAVFTLLGLLGWAGLESHILGGP